MIAPAQYPILFITGLAAGFVDAIAGGGGLITIPVLLNLNIPPAVALGTNKLQASFGSGGATWKFARSGLINPSGCTSGILYTFAGAVLGTIAVQHLSPELLKRCIPWLLVGIALYMLLKPTAGHTTTHARMKPNVFYLVFGLAIGFYDGFFGPGTGTFWTMAFILWLGYDMTKATAHTKLFNFVSNFASLLAFLFAGNVLFTAGLVMGAGQLTGSWIGAHCVVTKGTKLIRPVFITMALALVAKLLWQNWHSPH